jgi:protocatechuate 4,5-dioxygenase beta chain
MGKIVAGIGTSHVPSIGAAYDKGEQKTKAWSPLFNAYEPVQDWLAELKPDIAIITYNDHGCDFFFDKYPTFAIGAADEYPIGDEGFGMRPLPPVPGDSKFSWHLCEQLIYNEFDITVCQELKMEHGFLVPMNLCFSKKPAWPIKYVPLAVNVIQHPLPTAARCYKLGQAIRKAVEAYDEDFTVAIFGTGGMSHQLSGERFGYLNSEFDEWFLDQLEGDANALINMAHQELMERAGVEAVELIMWLVMRGAMSEKVNRLHRNYYAPMTTGMGLITLENAVS